MAATYIYLEDSSSVLWEVGVDDNGQLTSTPTTSVPPQTIVLADYATGTTAWTLSITTLGMLTTTPASLVPALPTMIFLTSPSGYGWALLALSTGALQTRAAGFGSFMVEDILEAVSFVLVEPFVLTTLGTTIAAGTQTVTPASMNYIYVGAYLIIGVGTSEEQVTVTAITSTSFTAVFTKAHNASDQVRGATFPSGQLQPGGESGFFLFTQDEMLQYVVDGQKDFLLKTGCYVLVSTQSLASAQRYYQQPLSTVRLERVALDTGDGYLDLLNTSAADLDMMQWANSADTSWQADSGTPLQWFQDESGTNNYGVYPLPNLTGTLEEWRTDRGPDSVQLDSYLQVPIIFVWAIKYYVLAKAFNKDGEQRDPQRARFCWEMYKLYVWLAIKFMQGVRASIEHGMPKLARAAQTKDEQEAIAGVH